MEFSLLDTLSYDNTQRPFFMPRAIARACGARLMEVVLLCGTGAKRGFHTTIWMFPLSPAFPEAGQNFLRVELQEARLIVAGCVEDQVREAEFDVGADLLDVLLGIA
jgi:hypothetical protein